MARAPHSGCGGRGFKSHIPDQESFYDKIGVKNVCKLNYKLRLWNLLQ